MTGIAFSGAVTGTRRGHPLLARMLEGPHPWGDLWVACVDHTGGVRYHLTVFPPGINAAQRRALVFRRRWIPWGAIIGFLVASGFSIVMNGWLAIAFGTALYVGALLIANERAGSARHGVVELDAQRTSAKRDPDAFGTFELLDGVAARLLSIDELAAVGSIDPVEYERRWIAAYRRILDCETDPESERD